MDATSYVAPLALVGFLYVASKLISLARLLLSLFVLPGKSLRSFGPKGSWALVTGCTDGIGLEFATQLARAHFNVVLVSRSEPKLAALAAKLEETYKVRSKTFAMDFACATPQDYERLGGTVAGLDVAVLVNNVGRSHAMPVPFARTEPEEMRAIVEINVVGTLRMTSLVLPGMQARRRGLILTMGSFGGLLPTPLLATYSGSKAFLQQWSSALGAEVAPDNVRVELVQSYLVASNMSKIRRPSLTVPTPRSFVRSVLARVGRSGGAQGWAYTSTPFWSHAVMQWSLSTFVGLNNTLVVGRNKAFHEAIRKRALRKRERDAAKKAA